MSARSALLFALAAVTIGCGENGSPTVTITDLHVKQGDDGFFASGTFALHVAQPAEAAGPGAIKLHELDLDFGDSNGVQPHYMVSRLSGEPPGEVAPGDDVVSTIGFELNHSNGDSGDSSNACATPSAFSLTGAYFDESASAFFPVRSAPAWVAPAPLTGATWSESLGDAGLDLEGDVAAFADGSSVMVGSTSGTLDFSGKKLAVPQATSPFLVKLDPAGQPLWSRYFTSSYIDPQVRVQGVHRVAAAPDGGAVVAGLLDGTLDLGGGSITAAGDTDVFFARFDAAGKHLETRRLGDGLRQTLLAIDVDAAGNVIVVGGTAGAIDFGADSLVAPILDPSFTSYFSARLPAAGAPIYARIPLAITVPTQLVAAAAADGAVVFGGAFTGKAWLGADPIVEKPAETAFLEKLAADGSLVWSTAIDGAVVLAVGLDQGDVVAAMTFGPSVLIGGKQMSGGPTGTLGLARFDPQGALRSWLPIAAAPAASVTSLVIDSAGHALLAGHALDPHEITALSAAAGAIGSSFFTEIDRDGLLVRAQAFGCSSWPVDLAVARQGARDVILASTHEGAIDLGQGVVPSAGLTDLLVARLPAR
ncbi:MAG: hypothetical protein ABJE95_30105 [Byssovorax sp.]